MKQSINQRWRLDVRRKEISQRKLFNAFSLVGILAVIIAWWQWGKKVEHKAAAKCREEYDLSFAGVVSQYKTDVFAERSTFILNDSIKISIPRSSKEVYFADGDTVMKTKGNHIYLVKWQYANSRTGQRVLRYTMDCSNSL